MPKVVDAEPLRQLSAPNRYRFERLVTEAIDHSDWTSCSELVAHEVPMEWPSQCALSLSTLAGSATVLDYLHTTLTQSGVRTDD